MKSIHYFLLVLCLPLFCFTTCKRVYVGKDDRIIVGWGGGIAAQARYYLIGNGQLRKDTVHTALGMVPDSVEGFQFDVVMPDSMYRKVADLKQHIPAELLNHNNTTYGRTIPDGGYYEVRTMMGGKWYKWLFEMDQRKSSAAVKEFYGRLMVLH